MAAARAQIPAFPGAEGYGAYAVGGRNGDVYHVTNLNASGAGSFADAIATVPSAGRTIVFDVSGYIRFPSGSNGTRMTASKVTIAGQTAPGDGIGFTNNFFRISGDDVVLRHLRFRLGYASSGGDCVDLDSGCTNAILDHLSMQFSTDENISSFGSPPENLTLQYSLNAWGLETHSCGGLWDQKHATCHHSLWAYNHTRNPKSRPTGLLEWINNTTFDWDIGFILGDTSSNTNYKANVVGSYFLAPRGNQQSKAFVKPTIADNGKPNFSLYLSNNLHDNDGDGLLNGTDKGFSIVEGTAYDPAGTATGTTGAYGYYKYTTPFANTGSRAVTTDDPLLGYKKVVSNAGALRLDANLTSPLRDEVDTILFSRLATQTHLSYSGQTGIHKEGDTGASNGGFGTLATTSAPTDTDRDGMPDYYEDALGWNKAADDHTTALASSGGVITGTTFFPASTPAGYTRLEEYLHFLAIPHATVGKNVSGSATSLTVDLRRFTAGFPSSPTFAVSNVVGGTVALTGTGNANATFTPTLNYSGRARFDFTVTDAQGSVWTQTLAVLVSTSALPRDLLWPGTASAWDTATADWLLLDTGAPIAFGNGDRVTLDDTGLAQGSLAIAGALAPTTVEVDASGNYVFGGTGSINSTGTLAKRGAGTLTLATAQTYTGGGAVEAGTVNVADGGGLLGGKFFLYDGVTLANTQAAANTASISTPLEIPVGNAATVKTGNRSVWSGALTGAGTLNLVVQTSVSRADLKGATAAFAGNVNFSGTGGVRLFFGSGFSGYALANVNLGDAVSLQPQTNSSGNTLGIAALSGASTSASLAGGAIGGAVTYSVGGAGTDTTFAGAITGTTAALLTKVGAGKLTLSGTSTYTGATTVSAGELSVTGTLGATPVAVASGAQLSGTGTLGGSVSVASGGTLSPGGTTGTAGNLSVGSLSLTAARLVFDLSANAGGSNDHIQLASGGALTLAGALTFQINLADGVLNAGTYKLIETTGTLGATGATLSLSLPTGGGSRQTFTLQRAASGAAPGYVQLVVSGAAVNLVWTGSSSVWDTGTTTWSNGGGTDRFYNFDAVTFDDGAASTNVTLSGTVSPRTVAVNNGAKNYVFGGAGRIGGIGALVKTGTGTLTINVAPLVTVASTTTAGSASVTVADASGLAVGMLVEGSGVPAETIVSAISGTTLTLSNAVTVANSAASFLYSWKNTYGGGTMIGSGSAIVLSNDNANAFGLGTGAITFNGGTLSMYSDTSTYNAATYSLVVPTGQTGLLNADARCDLYGTLTGGGTFYFYTPFTRTTLFTDWSAFTGRINVTTDADGGDLRMGTSYSFPGFPLASVNLADKVSAYYIGTLNSGAGTTIEIGELSGGPLSVLLGGPTGGRNFTYRIGGRTASTAEAVFAGTFREQNTGTTTNIVKTGVGTWTLGGTCNWNGGTTVEQGTLKISGQVASVAAANVNPGAQLALAGGTLAADTVSVASGATLTGYGAITGDLTNDGSILLGQGGQFSVSGDLSNNGTMRLTGGTALSVGGVFTNNGLLDLLTAGPGSLPASFVNNGVVIDSSTVKIKAYTRSAGSFTVTVDAYAGHGYQLQRATSLTAGNWQNVGSGQAGTTQSDGTPATITFTDPGATGTSLFYRVSISP